MKKVDDHEWNKWFNAQEGDDYGKRCFTYAEDWADLMEAEMVRSESVTLLDIAERIEPLAKQANTDGITGFMYSSAVAILTKCWIHGEYLRSWHNKRTRFYQMMVDK